MIREINSANRGFTIVELLIVIVIIGILAAITIVSYNGVSSRAKVAAAQSSLASANKQLEIARTTSGTNIYPASVPNLDPSLSYLASQTLGGYCLVNTSGTVVPYMTTSTNSTPHTGPASAVTSCQIANLASNPSFESGVANWSIGQRIAFARSTTVGASVGSGTGVMTRNTTTAGEGYINTLFNTTVGTRYSASFAVKNVTGTPILSASIRDWNKGWALSGTATINITPTVDYTRYTISWNATDTAEILLLENTSVTGVASAIAIDAVMITEGENAGTYTDPTLRSDWGWSGTAGTSTSTGPAF